MTRGKYIMIDGGEGCGKDLQADLLFKRFQEKGYEVIQTREPGGTRGAEQIRKVLLDRENSFEPLSEVFLFNAPRVENYSEIVIPSLDEGRNVIKVRGWPATYAYQGYAGGIYIGLINQLTLLSTQGIRPDLLCIIDIDSKLGLEKETNPDRFAAKGGEYHKRVNAGYLEVAKTHSDISLVVPYVKDGTEKMQEQIRQAIRNRLGLKI